MLMMSGSIPTTFPKDIAEDLGADNRTYPALSPDTFWIQKHTFQYHKVLHELSFNFFGFNQLVEILNRFAQLEGGPEKAGLARAAQYLESVNDSFAALRSDPSFRLIPPYSSLFDRLIPPYSGCRPRALVLRRGTTQPPDRVRGSRSSQAFSNEADRRVTCGPPQTN